MPANKYALLRYRVIDRCLTNQARPFPSKEEIREACEEALYGSTGERISASTIEKDLWAMRNESELGYYAPIAYDKANRGYFYEEEDYTINEISLNEEDLMAIRFAAKTLDQFRDVAIFRQYENAIDKIVNRVAISPATGEGELPFIQFETATSAFDQGLLQELCGAIEAQREIEFSYTKFTSGQSQMYKVHPLLLKEYRNRWYLIAYNPERQFTQTFGLERISDLSVTDRKFTRPSDFDPDRFFKYSIGITQLSAEPERIKVRITNTQAAYLQSQPLHPSQCISPVDDEYSIVEWSVYVTYELTSFILSLGSRAIVLEPDSLRDTLRSQIEEALGNYSI